MEVKTAIF